jgi:hypothetical protein
MNKKPPLSFDGMKAKIKKPLRHGIHSAGASVNSKKDKLTIKVQSRQAPQ